jgi:hypothetical protein
MFDRRAVMVWWLPEAAALAVSRQTRREAGAHPDAATMTAALWEAAADHGVTLTEYEVAVERAVSAVARVEGLLCIP